MRRARASAAIALVLSIASATAALVACSDLFHVTDDFKTACELGAGGDACAPATLDAATDVSPNDAPLDAPLDFCAWDATRARTAAESACKLLGMCQAPMGKQRFGECMVHALLAYDCHANANRQVKGATRDFWVCMAGVTSCGGVEACSYPVVQACPSAKAVTCGQLAENTATRVDCTGQLDAGARTENCAAWGQTCAAENLFSICAGDSNGFRCTTTGCDGNALHDCAPDGGSNVGVDCLGFGARTCVTSGAIFACAAEGAPCSPTSAITCDAGIARSCASGFEESVDCRAITALPAFCNASATASAALGAASGCFPLTACADSAPSESCTGSTLQSCYGGVTYSTECANGCALVTTPDGTRAACKKP